MAQETTRSWLLDYLPAIFHQDDGASGHQGSYLGQFLLPFGDVLSGFEELLAVIDSYFSPNTAPDDWVPWLAKWFAMDLDENWEFERKRELLSKAMDLHRRRGTVAGLKQFIKIYDPTLKITIDEGRRHSGMQIGVASRIGGFESVKKSSSKDQLTVDTIVSVKRQRVSDTTYGLYFLETTATADHPLLKGLVNGKHPETGVKTGDVVQLVLRTNQVKRMTVEGEKPEYKVAIDLQTPFMAKAVAKVDGREDDQHYIRRGPGQGIELIGDASLIVEVFTDQVEKVDLDKVESIDAGLIYKVSIHRKDGTIQFDATDVSRVDGFEDAVYRIETEPGSTVDFTGDTYLIEEVDAPYFFSIDVAVPERDWDEVTRPEGLRAISRIIEDTKPAHTTYSLTLSARPDGPRLRTMQIGVRSQIDDVDHPTSAIG